MDRLLAQVRAVGDGASRWSRVRTAKSIARVAAKYMHGRKSIVEEQLDQLRRDRESCCAWEACGLPGTGCKVTASHQHTLTSTLTELGEQNARCGRGIVSVQLQIGSIFSAAGGPKESLRYLEQAFECTKTDATAAPFAARIAGAIVWSYRRLNDEASVSKWQEVAASLHTAPVR